MQNGRHSDWLKDAVFGGIKKIRKMQDQSTGKEWGSLGAR